MELVVRRRRGARSQTLTTGNTTRSRIKLQNGADSEGYAFAEAIKCRVSLGTAGVACPFLPCAGVHDSCRLLRAGLPSEKIEFRNQQQQGERGRRQHLREP